MLIWHSFHHEGVTDGVCVAWVLTVIYCVPLKSEEVGFNPLERKGLQAAVAQGEIRHPNIRGLEIKGKFTRHYWEKSTATQKVNELAATRHGHEDQPAETQWAGEEIRINHSVSRLSELVAESFPN